VVELRQPSSLLDQEGRIVAGIRRPFWLSGLGLWRARASLRPRTTAGRRLQRALAHRTFSAVIAYLPVGAASPADQQHALPGVWHPEQLCGPVPVCWRSQGVPAQPLRPAAQQPRCSAGTFRRRHAPPLHSHRTCSDRLLGPGSPLKGPSPARASRGPTGNSGREAGITRALLQWSAAKRATACKRLPPGDPVGPSPSLSGGLHPHLLRGLTTQTRGRWRPASPSDVGLELRRSATTHRVHLTTCQRAGAPGPLTCIEQQQAGRAHFSARFLGGKWRPMSPRLRARAEASTGHARATQHHYGIEPSGMIQRTTRPGSRGDPPPGDGCRIRCRLRSCIHLQPVCIPSSLSQPRAFRLAAQVSCPGQGVLWGLQAGIEIGALR